MTEFGVNFGATGEPFNDPKWIAALKKSGAKWVRYDLSSDAYGTKKQMLQLCKTNGIKVLGIIGTHAGTNADRPTWNAEVDSLLASYDGVLDAVEVWNEPDHPQHIEGYMDGSPGRYMELLTDASPKIRAKGLKVVAGSVSNILSVNQPQSGGKDLAGGAFLTQIRQRGSDSLCDAYSFHIYKYWMQAGYEGISTMSQAQAKALSLIAGSGKELWMTESGWSDSKLGVGQVQWVQSLKQLDQCKVAVYWVFDDVVLTGTNADWGLLDKVLAEKPAFAEFVKLSAGNGGGGISIAGVALAGGLFAFVIWLVTRRRKR